MHEFNFILPDNGAKFRTMMFKADVDGPVTHADIPHLYVSKTWWEANDNPVLIRMLLSPGEFHSTFRPTVLKTKLKLEHIAVVGKTRREIAALDLPVTQIFVKLGVFNNLAEWNVELESRHV